VLLLLVQEAGHGGEEKVKAYEHLMLTLDCGYIVCLICLFCFVLLFLYSLYFARA
jgi:hypothetical protein